MKRLDDLLPKAMGRTEVLKAARAQKVMRMWPEVVGEMLASRTSPDRFDHGTVWVSSQGSAWAQELRMRQGEIVSRLNELAGENLFKEIRVGTRPKREG